ncbi:hypothetical protein JW968_02465 [Candidatus Woesearchaeota archaeon]|nr:hypothetical protein [Candidatus Woesearchaeota archaeon]
MRLSNFTDLLGDDPRIKVLDYMLENCIFDYTKKEIAENAGISRTTLDTFWIKLLEYGVLKKTRSIGNGTLYRLNHNSPIVKKMKELDLEITKAK